MDHSTKTEILKLKLAHADANIVYDMPLRPRPFPARALSREGVKARL